MHIDEVIREIGNPGMADASARRVPVNGPALMQSIQEEIARRDRKSRPGDALMPLDETVLPRWRPSQARLPTKREYKLSELLSFSDSDFVEQCYRIALRREPDLAGLEFHANRLRSGIASKVLVLGDIRFSAEGMRNGVHIDGLLLPYKLHRWMRIPVVGRGLRWLHAFARLDALGWRLQVQDSAQAKEAQHTGFVVNQLSASLELKLDAIVGAIRANEADSRRAIGNLEQQLEPVQAEVAELSSALADTSALIAGLQALLARQAQQIDHLVAASGAQGAAIAESGSQLASLQEAAASAGVQLAAVGQAVAGIGPRVEALQVFADAADPRLGGLEASLETLHPQVLSVRGALDDLQLRTGLLEAAAVQPDPNALDGLYADFENEFRGTREIVKLRVAEYLPMITQADAGTEAAPVIDLGCGRGEWLELLREQGLVGRGIDINTVFAQGCRDLGLDVELGDVFDCLARAPDASAGAITSMHLVEHLSHEGVIALIDAAFRVLRPGGVLIFETPNPENFQVGACWFYLDPSHRNPIPAAALRWTVQARGFSDVRVQRLTQHRDFQGPPRVEADLPGAHTINALSDMFMAPLDYAIIAVKP